MLVPKVQGLLSPLIGHKQQERQLHISLSNFSAAKVPPRISANRLEIKFMQPIHIEKCFQNQSVACVCVYIYIRYI